MCFRGEGSRLTSAVISVMEHGDIPIRLHANQELSQRSRSFREF